MLDEWESQIWTKNKPDINNILINIQSLPIISVVVKEWVMDRLKKCIDDYVKQKWLSSIALAESISEYATTHLIERYITENGIFSILNDTNRIREQSKRINLLWDLKIIDNDDKRDLEFISNIRNGYLHVSKIQTDMTQTECFKIINALNKFLTKRPIVANKTN